MVALFPYVYYRFPLEHLDDCDGSKYSLQLNMYRYMLEKYYGINISYMGLVSLHPTQDAYFHTEVPVRFILFAAFVFMCHVYAE